MGISYIRLESLAGISGKVELSGDSKWKWSRMGEGQRVSGASPLKGCKGYLSLWGPADSARVPHLPVFDELGTRLQTGAIRQIFIQKQGSHSGHQGHVRDPGTPSFKCTEHCWKKPWFLIKPISFVLYESKKQDLRFFSFLVFAAQKQIFLENLWSSSSSFHIEVVPTFSTTPEQPAIHSNRLDYKDGIFWFSSWKKRLYCIPTGFWGTQHWRTPIRGGAYSGLEAWGSGAGVGMGPWSVAGPEAVSEAGGGGRAGTCVDAEAMFARLALPEVEGPLHCSPLFSSLSFFLISFTSALSCLLSALRRCRSALRTVLSPRLGNLVWNVIRNTYL